MFYHVPYALDNIATWYDHAPVFTQGAFPKWIALSDEVQKQTDRLLAKYDVEILRVTGQPYSDAYEMFDEIETGKLQISVDNNDHPVFTYDTNFNFRLWHDLAHFEAYADFSYNGEVKTYQRQLQHVQDYSTQVFSDIRHALFVEVLGQAASMIHNGKFNIQKIF